MINPKDKTTPVESSPSNRTRTSLPAGESKRKNKNKEPAGSRWAGLVLLFITVFISLFFYLQMRLSHGLPGIEAVMSQLISHLFGQQTYRFEK